MTTALFRVIVFEASRRRQGEIEPLFEKAPPKLFCNLFARDLATSPAPQEQKSFLVLFFKKEPLCKQEAGSPTQGEGRMVADFLGTLRTDGRLTLAGGRLRDMIIRGGENIYPVEIESVLATHPGIAEAAVFGMPDAFYGEIVAAAIRFHTPIPVADIGFMVLVLAKTERSVEARSSFLKKRTKKLFCSASRGVSNARH